MGKEKQFQLMMHRLLLKPYSRYSSSAQIGPSAHPAGYLAFFVNLYSAKYPDSQFRYAAG